MFLLGAGFGVDAGPTVGAIEAESFYVGKYRFQCAYPLVKDLPRICFPDSDPAVTVANVERRIGEELEAGNYRPIDRMCAELSKADHYLAPPLVGWPANPNAYSKFFAEFPGSSFATYNYDAFVEFALFRAGRWFPHDGYGVKVATELGYTAVPYEKRASTCLVLHLHGTLMVYSYDHLFGQADGHRVQWLEQLDASRFAFDPYSLTSAFYPFERGMAGLSYNPDVKDRIVAPVPDKAKGLKAEFIQSVTRRAEEMVAQTGAIIAIGYAFAESDSASYSGLLDALSTTRSSSVLVVTPDATSIVDRLRPQYPKIHWAGEDRGFAAWVNSGYPGR